ncbi:hypothetical protein AJ78_05430 [Emergomyces pasteurianus Ep9510]|uniref:Uncharacterized protein n=1 Tax=Emergomyces pasteurianus Ep9510 TaxID=1447872 RepID=A0A1J9PCE1_9EURO|nr:hypothetical protein AJ78_05430 [Emergomyces pasteurianus Ep9510]
MATKTHTKSTPLPPQFTTSYGSSPQLQLNHLINTHIITPPSTQPSTQPSMSISSSYPYAPPIDDPAPYHRSRPNVLKRLRSRLQLAYYRYEVTYGIYVMTPEEKFVANTFLLVFISLLVWGLFLYFPPLLFQKLGRLAWILTGAGMDGAKDRVSAELKVATGTCNNGIASGAGPGAGPGPGPGPGPWGASTGAIISTSSIATVSHQPMLRV